METVKARRSSRRVSERPGLPLVDMGTPTPPAVTGHASTRAARKAPATRSIPAHRGPDGVASFRHGLGEHERAVIDAALAILGCHLREPGKVFESPDAVKKYLRLHLAGERRELFAVLYLDSQHRAIAFETPFAGTLTQTSVYPRELVRAALAHEAAAVILAHNHPSGKLTPIKADEELTQTLKRALALVDVRVLDHVIVGGNEALSMAEKGLL